MNTISIQSTFTSQVDGVRTVMTVNQNTNTSSSNFIAGSQAVTGSGYVGIPTSSLDNVAAMAITNDSTVYSSSVITVATDSSGTKPVAVLIPGAQATIPWSGSIAGLYVKVTGTYPAYVGTTAKDGTVQFLLQQA